MSRGLVASVLLLVAVPTMAQERESHEKSEAKEAEKTTPALAAALEGAKVSLASGLRAAEKQGRPISGKFELEDGNLQLSVYTMKGDSFSEVFVDHRTGRVVKAEPINGGEDLAAARKQAEAMAKTKRSLREVIARAEKTNPGYHALSVSPEVEDGKAKAEVILLNGSASKSVDEPL